MPNPSELRSVAAYHHGIDLVERLRTVERTVEAKNKALHAAADEIERLQARVKELERAAANPNAYAPPAANGTHQA